MASSYSVPVKYDSAWQRVSSFIEERYDPISTQLLSTTISAETLPLPPGTSCGWPGHPFPIGESDEYFLLHLYVSRQAEGGALLKNDETPKDVVLREGIVCSKCLRPKDVGLKHKRFLYEECVCSGTTSVRLDGKEGEKVRIEGLASAEHLNNREGILGPFYPQKGRHKVTFNNDKAVLVRPENIELASVVAIPPWEGGMDRQQMKLEDEKKRRKWEAKLNPKQQEVGSEFFGSATKAAQKEDGKLYRCLCCQKTSSTRLLVCQGCNLVAYCGTECQKADWEDHKKLCQYTSKEGLTKVLSEPSTTIHYGHQPGRVHPMEDKIRNCPPVIRPGTPNYRELKKYCLSKKGKRTRKAIAKYVRKCFSTVSQGRELDKTTVHMTDALFSSWEMEEETSHDSSDDMTMFFEILAHNSGSQDDHSFHGEDGLLLLEFYARRGADLAMRYDVNGEGLIHLAAEKGLTDVIEWVVKEGVDPNQCTGISTMNTTTMSAPLHLAILYVQVGSVATLCKLPNIDLERRNLSGKTPLHTVATLRNHGRSFTGDRYSDEAVSKMLDTLKAAGADLEAKTQGSWHKPKKGTILKEKDGLNICDIAKNNVTVNFCVTNGIAPTKLGSHMDLHMRCAGFPIKEFDWDYIQYYIKSKKYLAFTTRPTQSEKAEDIKTAKAEQAMMRLLPDKNK